MKPICYVHYSLPLSHRAICVPIYTYRTLAIFIGELVEDNIKFRVTYNEKKA